MSKKVLKLSTLWHLVLILVNKTAINDNPYANLTPLNLIHDEKL
jgi:hypothetical protein